MIPQFINMFDLVDHKLGSKFKWTGLSAHVKAIISIVTLAMLTIGLGAASVFTNYSFLSLVILGVIYGVVLSYPVTKFFGPKLQSLVTGFLGGITLGNIGTQEAKVRAGIIGLGTWIKQLVAAANPPGQLNTAIVYGIWTAIVIAFAIVAANTYFANQTNNPVGTPVLKLRAETPVAGAPTEMAQQKATGV